MNSSTRKLAKKLRDAGKDDLCDALIATAASEGSISPRPDLSYSYVMRKLRSKGDKNRVKAFQVAFKEAFDEAYLADVENPDDVALLQALQKAEIEPIEVDESAEDIEVKAEITYNLTKLGQAATDLGNPEFAGRAIADIVKFLLREISFDKRPHSIMSLRQKILELDINEMSSKNSPSTAAMGQSITMIKTLLNGKDQNYIKQTLEHVLGNLV